MGQLFACCNKENKLVMGFSMGVKFCIDGLGKLGKIFTSSGSSRNTKPNEHQDETYRNQDTSTYKPGYYKIKPKPVEEKFDGLQGEQHFKVNYNPEVDQAKLDKKKKGVYAKVHFGPRRRPDMARGMVDLRERMRNRRNRYKDMNAVKVK